MAAPDIEGRKLVELYHRYVGEPGSKRDVYGYWIFVVGAVIGIAGMLIYQVEQALFAPNLAIREVAIILAAVGLPLSFTGIIVLLPVRRRAIQASIIGLLITFAAVYLFTRVYPQAWYVGPDYSAEIIAVYTVGIAILAAVAMLVPIITGEKGLLVEPEIGIGRDRPPLMVGETDRDAIYSIYKTTSLDWAWRIIQRDAIGESGQRAPTDTDARLALESIRPKLGRAGLLEITTAAFRLHRTDTDTDTDGWRWTLVREDGSVLATNDTAYPSRDAVEESVNFLKEQGPDAGVLDIRSAAFDIYETDDAWHWRLLDDRRNVLAHNPNSYPSEAGAQDGTEHFTQTVDAARILAVDPVATELYTDDAAWRWRLITTDDTLLTSAGEFDSRRDAEAATTNATDRLDNATVVDLTTPGYELYQHNGGWRWRLRNDTDELIATTHHPHHTEPDATAAIDRVRDLLPEADVLFYEPAHYEVYPDDGAWRWRFVTTDRRIVAESADQYDDRDHAEEAAKRVRSMARAADLIEFEHAAFQQYESGGEWRWRLIDEDGRVMTDSGDEFASQADVREAMTTLKEHAPTADVLEIDTAAFEIHRTAGEGYAWRLIDETGQLVASGAGDQDNRSNARDEVAFVRETAEPAKIRTLTHAVFQVYTTDAEEWAWRLIAPDGTVLADATTHYPTRDDATTAIEEIQLIGDTPTVDSLGPLWVQLRRNGEWHWRVVDTDRATVATGDRTHQDRSDALSDITTVTDHARDAPVFELGMGVFWIDHTADGWHWRLLDATRTPIAHADTTFDSRDRALETVETITARVPDATRIAFETAVFELYRDDDTAWHWRLLAQDETIMAASAVAYDLRRDAETAVDDLRDVVPDASIIELEDAAYELHRRNDGWIWRLVDETATPLVESATTHPTRKAARDEMNTVKQHAPDGTITVTR